MEQLAKTVGYYLPPCTFEISDRMPKIEVQDMYVPNINPRKILNIRPSSAGQNLWNIVTSHLSRPIASRVYFHGAERIINLFGQTNLIKTKKQPTRMTHRRYTTSIEAFEGINRGKIMESKLRINHLLKSNNVYRFYTHIFFQLHLPTNVAKPTVVPKKELHL